MARNGAKTGKYDLRVVILRRVLADATDNNEQIPSWPQVEQDIDIESVDLLQPPFVLDGERDPSEFFACRDSLNSGETIVQGLNQSLGGMRLRIKGRSIPVSAAYRVKVKHTGEMFHVTGVARENADTVLSVERMHSQTVGQ